MLGRSSLFMACGINQSLCLSIGVGLVGALGGVRWISLCLGARQDEWRASLPSFPSQQRFF